MLSGLSFFTATNVGELSLGLNQRPGHTMLQIACVATMVHLEQRRKNEFLSSVRTLMLVKKLQETEASRLKAEHQTEIAAAEALLLREQLKRLKLDILSLRTHEAIEPVQRVAAVTKAWTTDGQWHEVKTVKDDPATSVSHKPTFPHAAVWFQADGSFTAKRNPARVNTDASEMTLQTGSHAFVKVHEEDFLRAAIVPSSFGNASGHPILANERAVLYAGEIEIENNRLVRWSNVSGTYKCSDDMAFQSGLPLDLFWAIQSASPANPEDSDWCEANGIWIRKVLQHSDDEVLIEKQQWAGHVEQLVANRPDVAACQERLAKMTKQRVEAIERYGYLNELTRPEL